LSEPAAARNQIAKIRQGAGYDNAMALSTIDCPNQRLGDSDASPFSAIAPSRQSRKISRLS
jgi:hypothetical protein